MRSGRRGTLAIVALAIVGALVLSIVASFVAASAVPLKPYRVPSEAMLPTIEVNDRVLVETLSDPGRGDIVVLEPPRGADLNTCGAPHPHDQACPRPTRERSDVTFIKRVVGEPGDRLKVIGGRVHIDGEPLDEDYARLDDSCVVCNLDKEITIPADHYFMMGDNRGQSADSREWGPVPSDWIIGRVFVAYWPPNRIRAL